MKEEEKESDNEINQLDDRIKTQLESRCMKIINGCIEPILENDIIVFLTTPIPLSSDASNFITIKFTLLLYNSLANAIIVDVLPVPEVP